MYVLSVNVSLRAVGTPWLMRTRFLQTGSWQEYVTTPADYTPRIPDGVDDFIAAPLMCSATTMYRSIVESNLKPGSWACFPGGAGGVGIQGVQLAKAVGLRPIVIDAGADKKDLSVKMGAEAFVDFRETKDVVAAVVMIADGIGAHGVFVTAPQAYATAVDLVGSRVGAIVMCVGLRKWNPSINRRAAILTARQHRPNH